MKNAEAINVKTFMSLRNDDTKKSSPRLGEPEFRPLDVSS